MLLAPAKRSASALYGEVLYTGHISFPLAALLSVSPAVPMKEFTALCHSVWKCNKLQGLVMPAVREALGKFTFFVKRRYGCLFSRELLPLLLPSPQQRAV